jgi:hypothetical protein
MPGPDVTVWLPRAITEEQEADLFRMMEDVSRGRQDGEHYTVFRVVNTLPIEGRFTGDGLPILFSARTCVATVLADYRRRHEQVISTFGFVPAATVWLAANVNGPASHRVLGELCLWVAERFGGIINFGGALLKGWKPRSDRNEDWCWEAARPHAEAFLSSLPGKVIAQTYTTARGPTWASHVADATFMRAWLDHPEFFMIK